MALENDRNAPIREVDFVLSEKPDTAFLGGPRTRRNPKAHIKHYDSELGMSITHCGRSYNENEARVNTAVAYDRGLCLRCWLSFHDIYLQ